MRCSGSGRCGMGELFVNVLPFLLVMYLWWRLDRHDEVLDAMRVMLRELQESNEFLHGAIDELTEDHDAVAADE